MREVERAEMEKRGLVDRSEEKLERRNIVHRYLYGHVSCIRTDSPYVRKQCQAARKRSYNWQS